MGPFESLLPQLTLEEKVSLLSGDGFHSTPGVSRLNIPPVHVADSVNGVRPQEGAPAETVCFPSTTCLASTWDTELMERLGEQLADQARVNNCHVILGPTVNIHRDPRGGRNFECFSEDPLLSGLLGAGIVNGLQKHGIGACPKHFVCNDSETFRRKYDVRETVNGRTLREIYLASFQHLIRNSNPWALMTAYNKLSGSFCSENSPLFDVLKQEWGYTGCLMSDWFGTHSTAPSINAGLDLEMPGPSIHRGKKLIEAVNSGTVAESTIDKHVANLLRLRDHIKYDQKPTREGSALSAATNSFARELASEGIILLKNAKSTLPLSLSGSTKIALVGGMSQDPVITGGGSASNTPPYLQTPLDCLKNAHPSPNEIRYAQGVRTRVIIPEAPKELLTAKDGRHGVDIVFRNNGSDMVVCEEFSEKPVVDMLGWFKPGLTPSAFNFEITTTLTPKSTGNHTLAVRVTGDFLFSVDGKVILEGKSPNVSTEHYLFCPHLRERRVNLQMNAGQAYAIKLVTQNGKLLVMEPTANGAAIAFEEYLDEHKAIAEAASLASDSDITVIYAGRDGQYESEGFDLDTTLLPDNQNEMIKAVAAASKCTVLVLHCGNPIDVSPFVDDVDAILNAHFPGQEGAQALVDILLGKVNPSGKLATTWFNQFTDALSLEFFPAKQNGEKFEIRYEEGLQVGYRADKAQAKVRWPFGFGLSYTTFGYSDLTVKEVNGQSPLDSVLECTVTVTNTGNRMGKEVVQLYVSPPATAGLWRPTRELRGFTKVSLEPGESKVVHVQIESKIGCSYWDESQGCWRLESGLYSARVAECSTEFRIAEGVTWTGL